LKGLNSGKYAVVHAWTSLDIFIVGLKIRVFGLLMQLENDGFAIPGTVIIHSSKKFS